jgi:formate-dependent nitrite reductase membrane component NrfD
MKSFARTQEPKPYEWMIKPTPQKEWIDGKGVYLWLAFFFSEIGAGIYFLSLFFDFYTGFIVGWLMTLVIGGGVHMLYLGNPTRVFRIFFKPGTSELSRGMWVILLFAVLGFFQILPGIFPALGWTGLSIGYKVIMGILCILLIMHGFATMNVVRALPAWNSSVMLPLSIISGIWVGSQFVQIMLGATGHNLATLEMWSRLFLFVYIGFLVFYLWGTFHEDETARFSVRELVRGDYAQVFYLGVVAVGIVVPLLLTFIMWGTSISLGLVFLRLLFVFAGDLMMRYSIMKSAFYTPLI